MTCLCPWKTTLMVLLLLLSQLTRNQKRMSKNSSKKKPSAGHNTADTCGRNRFLLAGANARTLKYQTNWFDYCYSNTYGL